MRTRYVAVLLVLATGIYLAPVFGNPATDLPAHDDERVTVGSFEYTYYVHHFTRAFQGEEPFARLAQICHPDGLPLGWVNVVPSVTAPAGALAVLPGVSPILAFNMMLFIAAALTVLAAALAGRHLTGSRLAGAVTGIVFIANPSFLWQGVSRGLPKATFLAWYPLIIVAIERLIERRRRRDAAVLGLFAAGQAYTSLQMTAALSIVLPVYIGVRLGMDRVVAAVRDAVGTPSWRLPGGRILFLAAVAVGTPLGGGRPAFALLLAAMFLAVYVGRSVGVPDVSALRPALTRPPTAAARRSIGLLLAAGPIALLLFLPYYRSFPADGITPTVTPRTLELVEPLVGPLTISPASLLALLAAGGALLAVERDRRPVPLLLTALAGFAFYATAIVPGAPYRWVRAAVPYFAAFKGVGQFRYVSWLFVAVAVGMAVARLRTAFAAVEMPSVRRLPAVAVALLMVVLAVIAAGPHLIEAWERVEPYTPERDPVHERIGTDAGEGAVVEYPMGGASMYNFNVLRHGRPTANCRTSLPRDAASRAISSACGSAVPEPSRRCLGTLRQAGVRYVVLNAGVAASSFRGGGIWTRPGCGQGPLASAPARCCLGAGNTSCLLRSLTAFYNASDGLSHVASGDAAAAFRVRPLDR